MSDMDAKPAAADMPEGESAEMMDECSVVLEVVSMNASMTAIGSLITEELDASQCAIGSASVDGDASIGTSCIGMLSANSVGVHQGLATAILVDGDVSIDQGGACMIAARTAGLEKTGVGVMVAGDASLAHSWVGVMAARNATLSDDSRVIIDTRSALIIGGLLFGGLGLVAVAVFFAGKRMASRMPHLPHMPKMPHMADLQRMAHLPRGIEMPKIELPKIDVSAIVDMVSKLKRAG